MYIMSDYNSGFKQAGFVPEADDLLYLGQEQDLYREIPQFLTAEFRQCADSFFDIGITKAMLRMHMSPLYLTARI